MISGRILRLEGYRRYGAFGAVGQNEAGKQEARGEEVDGEGVEDAGCNTSIVSKCRFDTQDT